MCTENYDWYARQHKKSSKQDSELKKEKFAKNLSGKDLTVTPPAVEDGKQGL